MLSKKPKNHAGSVKLLEFLGTPAAEETYLKGDPSVVAASTKSADAAPTRTTSS
jgi:multiple sugar transport system substrate-binding protein